MFRKTQLVAGERVRIANHSRDGATFIEYGDPRLSCPDTFHTLA